MLRCQVSENQNTEEFNIDWEYIKTHSGVYKTTVDSVGRFVSLGDRTVLLATNVNIILAPESWHINKFRLTNDVVELSNYTYETNTL